MLVLGTYIFEIGTPLTGYLSKNIPLTQWFSYCEGDETRKFPNVFITLNCTSFEPEFVPEYILYIGPIARLFNCANVFSKEKSLKETFN